MKEGRSKLAELLGKLLVRKSAHVGNKKHIYLLRAIKDKSNRLHFERYIRYTVNVCEHRPEWIRERGDGEYYCTVCRATIYDEWHNILSDEEKKKVGRSFDYDWDHPMTLEELNESFRQR